MNGRGGTYHQAGDAASDAPRGRPCPLCGRAPDRFRRCASGHAALRVTGGTHEFVDWRDHILVDVDAPVLAWRQGKGQRLAREHSHEALAWNLFRSLERAGRVGELARWLDPAGGDARVYYWGRDADAVPLAALADARAELERHLRGPDVNGGAADVLVVDERARRVTMIDVHLTSPLSAPSPAWFLFARTTAEQRRRRAILDALAGEEAPDAPFRRGLAELMKRELYAPARRLLLSRATARRLGDGWRARLLSLVHPPTVRGATDDAARFTAQLAPAARDDHRLATFSELWRALSGEVPPPLTTYMRSRTVNGSKIQLIHG